MKNLESEWERIESVFSNLVEERDFDLPIILDTIRGLRLSGYSKYCRPGSSLYNFIISRSLKYGLRDDQCKIMIVAGKNKWSVEGGEVIIYVRNLNGKSDGFRTSNPMENEKFITYLEELKNCPMN